MMRGLFVSIEGVDGSGKTTQVGMLEHSLLSSGYRVRRVREPGGTGLGDRIRQVLLETGGGDVSPVAELLLYSAARAQLVKDVIAPSLKEGLIVIADRYAWSTLAYQGFGRGLDKGQIKFLLDLACDRVWPDHSFLLDIPADLMEERMKSENRVRDRMEMEDRAFFGKVIQGYREVAGQNPDCFTVLDGTGDKESIHHFLLKKISEMAADGAPMPAG